MSVILELDINGFASCVHGIIERLGNEPMNIAYASALAAWDQLVDNPVVMDPDEGLRIIHEQVDAVLNGSAVVTIRSE